VIIGGEGGDTFLFARGYHRRSDDIRDFTPGQDKLEMPAWIFRGLGTDGLTANELYIGAAAHDIDDRIIYNSATGSLYYDSNGSNPGHSARIAKLAPGLDLSISDFLIS
jgi:serralysin